MSTKREVVLSLDKVSLRIPVFSKTELSLKKSFYRAVTGSRVSHQNNISSVEALNSISLKIYRGEKIALIGHNGSGKSSFLRLISEIYFPSSGKIYKKVKPYPMLTPSFIVSEVLTGIDSAKAHYLIMNNSLKGFDNFLEYIIEVSGIGEYLYLPLKTYSEGMASRLSFSLLTYHKHDCLALDEGIGTGDQNFYKKAQKRLDEYLTSNGMLILSSHSNALLKKFCKRGLVFSSGSIVFDGPLKDALTFYEKKSN